MVVCGCLWLFVMISRTLVVVVSTTNLKVVDVEIMTRPCTSKEELRKTEKIAFDKWKIDHEAICKANYRGSAGSMEAARATKVFQRSVHYISYYGDGRQQIRRGGEKCLSWNNCGKVRMHRVLTKAGW